MINKIMKKMEINDSRIWEFGIRGSNDAEVYPKCKNKFIHWCSRRTVALNSIHTGNLFILKCMDIPIATDVRTCGSVNTPHC